MNELLQLLLVMDVERVGSLTYEQWTRGVLCLPEVLGCFQLASIVAQPATPTKDPLFRRHAAAAASGGAPGMTGTPMAVASVREGTASIGVVGGLWWRSVWRSLSDSALCTACGR